MDEIRKSQVIRAIELYYLENLTQNDISKLMNVSRPTVSRLLEEGRKIGYVEIKVNTPVTNNGELSNRIRETFKLKNAIVVDANRDLNKVAKAAALFFKTIVSPSSTIGISWGKSVSLLVDYLDQIDLRTVTLLQVSGSLGMKDSNHDSNEIVLKLSKKLNCEYKSLNIPAVLPDKEVVKLLKNDKQVQEVLTIAENMNIFIGGVGSFKEPSCRLQTAGYLSDSEKNMFIQNGAVGHVLSKIISNDGLDFSEFNDRVLTIDEAILKKVDYSMCIACGLEKADALVAAINGGLFNCVVIDKSCALAMLNEKL